MNRDRRRTSIHDITNVNNSDAPSYQMPITGSTNQPNGPGAPMKHRPHQPNMPPGMGMYGAPMGHVVAATPGHMPSAVGTPVMMPHNHHPPYVMPVAYPMAPPTTMHQ
ncbi:hypothetical protein M8C21_002589 [Ambrosia artemisiifolia]|uniref:Uncharacterized protein n=1 Tax=Ambrosia artemisiifolia TaxID=4212 RepID=A0AAD5BX18_AMBAR|nr:hypothetical protein M8C21_002589 [Ambrosia artemisiifolia]